MDATCLLHQFHRARHLSVLTPSRQRYSVPELQQQETPNKHSLSSMRIRLLNRQLLCLLLVAGAVIVAVGDAMRVPQQQASVKVYLLAIDGYERYLHPFTHHFIRCRYYPTCSRYSIQAVQSHGIVRGLSLTVRRILSCRSNVPYGTYDPIPL
jgi:uncharacterized protein